MNNAINNHSIFAYDDTLIEKIRQILQQGLEKLKAFVKTRKESKFTVYDELDEKFNEIAQKLEKCEILNDEFNYFLAISDKILYIVKKNCEDPSFDHCEFALELFDFFKELWDQKIELLNDFSDEKLKSYEIQQTTLKRRYFELNKRFHRGIYVPNSHYSEKEISSVMKQMRG